MGRKSIYTTADERRKAQARRDEQITLNEERHKLKNKKKRERQQQNRARETLQRKTDIAESSKQLDNERGNKQSAEQDEAVEAFSLPDENASDYDIYGDQGGFGDNFPESSGLSPDI